MKWLKKRLYKWIISYQDRDEECDEPYAVTGSGNKAHRLRSVSDSNHVDAEPVLSFRIYGAQNGKIVEFSKYDQVKDRTERSIYIINKDDDISEKVGKCISLELLR